MQTEAKKIRASLSYRVAIRRKSFNRPKAFSMRRRSLVDAPVEAERLLSVATVGNDWLGSAILQPLTQLGTVVGLAADQAFRCFACGDEPFRDRQSCASPPVRRIARRRPRASASAWTFVLRPPLERPIACFCSPLFHPLPSGAHVRGVDHLGVCRSTVSGKFPEQIFPDPAPRPAHEAVIDRRRRPPGNRTSDSRFSAPARCR